MPAIVRVVGSFVGSASARRRAQRPPSSTRPRSADRIESRTCCWRTPTKMKASESNGEIGRTNCDGMTANSGLVSADLAETVERMEPAAGARTCSSFFARGASTCAQPALTRLSAVPSHAKFGAEKFGAHQPRARASKRAAFFFFRAPRRELGSRGAAIRSRPGHISGKSANKNAIRRGSPARGGPPWGYVIHLYRWT